MLNTKSIKKINSFRDVAKSDINHKTINIESSKQKELENIVRQANNIINADQEHVQDNFQEEIKEEIQEQLQPKIINPVIKEFTDNRYLDTNLNLNSYLNGHSVFNNIPNVPNVPNISNIPNIPNISNIPNIPNIPNKNYVLWNNNNNSYDIFINDVLAHNIKNENILKAIINNGSNYDNNNDYYVKKYFFITNWNSLTNNYEFNIVDSILTNDFDIMIRIQNYIYDTLINFNNLDIYDTYNYYDAILFFYFQLLIYFFNNTDKYINNYSSGSDKLSKVYSSFVYRFSSLILKNILRIKNDIDNNNEQINQLMSLRNDLMTKLNSIENILINHTKTSKSEMKINSNFHNSEISSNNRSKASVSSSSDSSDASNASSDSSDGSDSSDSSDSSDTISSSETKKITDSFNKMNSMIALNKKKAKVKNISDLLSEDVRINTDTDNFNSEQNGYYELSDENKNNLINDIDKINPLEPISVSNNNSNHNSNNNSNHNSNNNSYNMNSAKKNSKIYSINIL